MRFSHYHLGLNDVYSFATAMGVTNTSVNNWLSSGRCPLKHQDDIEQIRTMHSPIDELSSNNLVCIEVNEVINYLNQRKTYAAYCICDSETNNSWSWNEGDYKEKNEVNTYLLRLLLNISIHRNPNLKKQIFGFSELCRIRKKSKNKTESFNTNGQEKLIWEFIYIKSSSVILSYIFKNKEDKIRGNEKYRSRFIAFAIDLLERVKHRNKKYLKGEISFNTLNLISVIDKEDEIYKFKDIINDALSIMIPIYGKNQTIIMLKDDPETKVIFEMLDKKTYRIH